MTLAGERVGDDSIEAEIREHVAVRIGKFARPRRIIWTDDLPKTRSGKIMRRLLRDIAEGREVGDVTTLRDAGVVAEIQKKVADRRPRRHDRRAGDHQVLTRSAGRRRSTRTRMSRMT